MMQQNMSQPPNDQYGKINEERKLINKPETHNKESKIKIKKLNLQFPIVFRSQEYFNTIDYGRNYIKSAMNEIDRGNLNNSLEYLETVRQYFNQIK